VIPYGARVAVAVRLVGNCYTPLTFTFTPNGESTGSSVFAWLTPVDSQTDIQSCTIGRIYALRACDAA